MHIAIVTAGGAGMYCGSCMHDNTWARGLLDSGEQVTLIPTYTPIRVDEENASSKRVFLGGLNVYLRTRSRLWRGLPRFLTRWVDRPGVIKFVTSFAISSDAKELGELTQSMLDANSGPQKVQYEELARYIATEVRPDIVCFSNALLAGALPALRREFAGPILCTLQGDDIFLDGLVEPFRTHIMSQLKGLVSGFDGFVTHSRYYREHMSRYLDIPVEKFRQLALSIDLRGHTGMPGLRAGQPFTVGYFARVCPEKGLHQLVDAFRIFHRQFPTARLLAGGYLGQRDVKYLEQVKHDARDLGDAFEYIGSPDRAGKQAFFQSIDVLSIPTVYQEPKGLSVLEALANGIPVVLPRHGAFPELVAATGGGELVHPGNPEALAAAITELLLNPERRLELGRRGRETVHQNFHPQVLAAQTLQLFQTAIQAHAEPKNGLTP
jgi:glycosyltransferase involved in cell wall biosynthesis